MPMIAANVTTPVHISRTTITGLDGDTSKFVGTGPLTFSGSTLKGKGGAAPLTFSSSNLTFHDTAIVDTGIVAAGTADQTVTVTGGSRTSGTPGGKAFFSRAAGAGTLTWTFDGLTSQAPAADVSHIVIDKGVNHYRALGSSFSSGALNLSPAGFGAGSSMLHSGCVESGVNRAALPAAGPAVVLDGNLEL